MQITLAPRDFSDWPALVTLVRDAFAYMDARIDPPSSLNRMSLEDFKAKAREETLILAKDDGALVGCAFAALRDDCVYLGKVAGASSHRGRGLTRAMVEAAETLTRQHGRRFLELRVRVELVENHAIFGSLGFVKVGETAHAGYERPTSITMRKPVPESRDEGLSAELGATVITVAAFTPDKTESLTDLLVELHAHYVQPPTADRETVRGHLARTLSQEPNLCLAVAAGSSGEVLGLAALVLVYSLVEPGPEARRQCVLKELYVRSHARGQGIGERLVRWAAGYALRQGCGRMDWSVKATNDRGIAFYEALGGTRVADRLSYRLSREALLTLSSGAAQGADQTMPTGGTT